ncbi:RxLR effector protein, partial [Phytophthora megakarya]
MYHHYLACLGFIVSVVFIGADSGLADPKNTFESALQPVFSENGNFRAANEIDIAGARLLRPNKDSNERFANEIDIAGARLLRPNKDSNERYREERTGGISVSTFETLKSAFMSSKVTPERLEKWL